MWPFKKYRDELHLISEHVIRDERNLTELNLSTAKFLFSITKEVYCGCFGGAMSEDKIQVDYYKSENGNFIEVIRSLSFKDKRGEFTLRKVSEEDMNFAYMEAHKFPESVKLINDNYGLAITYTTL